MSGTKMVPQMSWMRKPLFADVTDEFGFFTALVLEMLRPRPLVAKTGFTTRTNEKIAHFGVVWNSRMLDLKLESGGRLGGGKNHKTTP